MVLIATSCIRLDLEEETAYGDLITGRVFQSGIDLHRTSEHPQKGMGSGESTGSKQPSQERLDSSEPPDVYHVHLLVRLHP
jgi:hypothetical protein